jgi:hypothetical protein
MYGYNFPLRFQIPPLNTTVLGHTVEVIFDRAICGYNQNNQNNQNNYINYYNHNRNNYNNYNSHNHNNHNVGINNVRNVGNISVAKNAVDPISQNEFEEGEEVVRLQGNDRFIFKRPGLQTWFQTSRTNPLTREAVNMSRVEKGKAAKFVGGRRTRKDRKGRKGHGGKAHKSHRR